MCYGLFDYSEENHSNSEKMVIKSTGLLLRNEINHELEFIEGKNKKKQASLENYIPLLKIEES
jgi:hypothetical protein